tara:strand:- start:67 stop:348 length:282 start_codon:yes stop_codon:yes gene_type:complete
MTKNTNRLLLGLSALPGMMVVLFLSYYYVSPWPVIPWFMGGLFGLYFGVLKTEEIMFRHRKDLDELRSLINKRPDHEKFIRDLRDLLQEREEK